MLYLYYIKRSALDRSVEGLLVIYVLGSFILMLYLSDLKGTHHEISLMSGFRFRDGVYHTAYM